jgi:uncharacterized membrane protein YbaN (DUF454 family)
MDRKRKVKMIIKIKNYIYIIFGFIFLGIGMVGIILPLLPTTPLLLLASICFVRGSKKFEVWFKGTNLYKKHLEELVKNKAMTKRKKITVLLIADCMIAIPFILLDNFLIRVLLILIVGYKYYYFFCKINTIKAS